MHTQLHAPSPPVPSRVPPFRQSCGFDPPMHPTSHRTPLHPVSQLHVWLLTPSKQVLCTPHGTSAQSSMFSSQTFPVHPSSHVQVNFPTPSRQLPFPEQFSDKQASTSIVPVTSSVNRRGYQCQHLVE
jgi:hypothetical protein